MSNSSSNSSSNFNSPPVVRAISSPSSTVTTAFSLALQDNDWNAEQQYTVKLGEIWDQLGYAFEGYLEKTINKQQTDLTNTNVVDRQAVAMKFLQVGAQTPGLRSINKNGVISTESLQKTFQRINSGIQDISEQLAAKAMIGILENVGKVVSTTDTQGDLTGQIKGQMFHLELKATQSEGSKVKWSTMADESLFGEKSFKSFLMNNVGLIGGGKKNKSMSMYWNYTKPGVNWASYIATTGFADFVASKGMTAYQWLRHLLAKGAPEVGEGRGFNKKVFLAKVPGAQDNKSFAGVLDLDQFYDSMKEEALAVVQNTKSLSVTRGRNTLINFGLQGLSQIGPPGMRQGREMRKGDVTLSFITYLYTWPFEKVGTGNVKMDADTWTKFRGVLGAVK